MGYIIILVIIAICLFFVPIICFDGEEKIFAAFCLIPLLIIFLLNITIRNYHSQCYNDIIDYEIIQNTDINNITSIKTKSEIYKKIIRINNNIEKNNKNKGSFWNGIWYDERYENLKMLNF